MNPSNQPEPVKNWMLANGFTVVEGAPGHEKFFSQRLDLYLPHKAAAFFYQISIPTTALPGSGQPDAQAGDDDTDVTISHAQAEVGLRENIAHEFALFMVDEYDTKRVDQTVGELHASLQRLELEFADRVIALFQANKSAAVVEARLDEIDMALAIKGKIYLHGSIVSAFDEQANTIDPKMLEMRRESLARLQPPTAGEGESV